MLRGDGCSREGRGGVRLDERESVNLFQRGEEGLDAWLPLFLVGCRVFFL